MPEEPPRTVVGRYLLCDEIASGGMASVHLGRMLAAAGFSRTVAVKRLHRHLANNPDFVAMFLDEARLVARIRHPNVVPTIDIVATDGELFLVMEFVHGMSLSHLLRKLTMRDERMPLDIACSIVVGALHGLHAAHEATTEQGAPLHVVHRDVSPHNVLLGADGLARVLDFGIAKASEQVHDTDAGQVKGKMAYMAPEQLEGTPVGPWTDVFASGIVLWELLTGARLFGKRDGALAGLSTNTIVPLVSSIVPSLPPELDAVLGRALQPRAEDRFQTAQAMADALEALAPLASPSAIARWLREVAGEELAAMATLIANVERRSAENLAADGREWLEDTAQRQAQRGKVISYVPSATPSSTEIATQIDVPHPVLRPEPSRKRYLRVALGGAGLLLAAAVAFRASSPTLQPTQDPPSTGAQLGGHPLPSGRLNPPELAPTPSPAPPSGLAPTPAASAAAATPPGAAAPQTLPSSVRREANGLRGKGARDVGSVTSRAAEVSSSTPVPSAAAQPAADDNRCNPPYLVDARGVRYMKLACLKH